MGDVQETPAELFNPSGAWRVDPCQHTEVPVIVVVVCLLAAH